MTTEEKVDKIYARVYNGLSENVAEMRQDMKEMRVDVHSLMSKWDVFIASREASCPTARMLAQSRKAKKTDVKYYVTTAIALGGVILAIVL